MTISPISYSSYQNSINVRKNLKNNPQISENQVAFKGLEKIATKKTQEAITKNSSKIFVALAGILGITTLQIKIANKKAQKEKEVLKAKTIKELSEEEYAETKIFGHYPNEWVGKEYYYHYNQATCEGIAEFIDDSTVFHALRTVLDPSSHEDVPIRNLTKDEVIELGNAIKLHGIGLFISYDCNYDRRSNKGAEIINQWKTGESLEDTINKIEKTKEAPLGTVNVAQQNPGITLRLATANSKEDFVPICGEIKASKPVNIEKIKQQIMNVYDKEIDFTKFDYTNSESHIKNLTKLSSVPSSSFSRIIDNGYFYSEDGLLAIEIASKYFKLQPEQRDFVSPLCLVLSEFTPREIIVLEKRGLLNAKTNILQERLHTITKMSDKEYEAFVIKTQNSIKSTGKSYEYLKQELFSLIKQTVSDTYYLELAERYLGAEESVVAQIEMLKFIKNTPLKLDKHDLLPFLSKININNSNNVKNVLDILLTKPNLKSHQLNSIISLTNNYTEKILIELLAITDLPVNKIIEICGHNNDFVNGKLSKEIIIEKINNDPYIKTIRAIKDTTVELRPSNTNITTLDPTNIEASSLALVHMTKYEPENGMILSTRDKLGGSRNSVHFTLNHAVTAHRAGDWDDFATAIIMPYSSTVKTNSPGKFIEGMPNDLYTNGSVKIPEGSVIVKQNKSLQEGIVKIVEHPTIKGVKLIETSMLPHDLVPTILNKMGYASIQGDAPLGLFNYGAKNGNSVDDVMQNFEAWNDFCKTQGLKPAKHTNTPGALAEALIEDVGKLNANESWIVESGREKTNYKKSILNDIEVLKKWQTKGYFISYDIDAFAKIIEESATPRQALMRMQKELNIHPTIDYKTFYECSLDHSLNIYEEWLIAVEDPIALRKYVIDKELH